MDDDADDDDDNAHNICMGTTQACQDRLVPSDLQGLMDPKENPETPDWLESLVLKWVFEPGGVGEEKGEKKEKERLSNEN